MKKGDSTLIIIFIIALALIAAVGAYLLFQKFPVEQQQENGRNEWKIFAYYDQYEFQYPLTWSTWTTLESEVPRGCFAQGESTCVNFNGLGFSVNKLPWTETTCREYYNGVGGPKAILQEKREINGRRFYYGKSEDDNLEIYHAFANGSCFELAKTISGDMDLNQILSTFRFANSSESDLPKIDTISPSSGSKGTVVEVKGVHLSGFEGDLDIYFERPDVKKVMLTDTYGDYLKTQDKLIKVKVVEPCQRGEKIIGRYSGI